MPLRDYPLPAPPSGAASELTERQLLQSVVEVARYVFGAAASSVFLVDGDSGDLIFEAVAGEGAGQLPGTRFPAGTGIVGWVAGCGQPMLADDLAEVGEFDRSAAESTGYVPRSIMAAPLIRDGECIGVLEVLDRGDRTNGELSDVDLLALLASQASIGLDLLVRLRGLSPHGPADRRGPLAGSASVLIQRIEDHLRTADRSTTEVALKFLTATDDLLSPRSQRG